jgi:eukaryotic-like serine/threonine-protein kinase
MSASRTDGPAPGPALPPTVAIPPAPPTASEGATVAPPGVAVPDGCAAAGVTVPGYEVLEELGRGAMGVVYKARQVNLRRVVALKMILAGGHAGATDRARFRAEAEAIARLQHPNIVQVYEVGEHEGRPFFSLELCEGGSLEKKLGAAPLPPHEAARVTAVLARAMHHAHLRGVVHRDLKAGNVLLTADGTPKVTDFGLAKLLDEAGQTLSGATMGTPSYMAPEQAAGEVHAIGPPADVYALGAILYEMLTGRPPFRGPTPLETIVQVVSTEPTPPRQLRPGCPRDLETVCLKCLEKAPSRRYPSAEALADDLERWLRGEPILARPPGPWGRVVRWAQPRPALAATLTALAAFYANHLLMIALGVKGEGGSFHWFVTALLLLWVTGAVVFQRLSNRPWWRGPATYGWAAFDVLLLTAMMLRANGPSSGLTVGYLLLVAASGLRFRPPLVVFVTGLCLLGYLVLLADARWRRPELGLSVPLPTAFIFVLSLALMGLIVGLLLRRFRLALAQER